MFVGIAGILFLVAGLFMIWQFAHLLYIGCLTLFTITLFPVIFIVDYVEQINKEGVTAGRIFKLALFVVFLCVVLYIYYLIIDFLIRANTRHY